MSGRRFNRIPYSFSSGWPAQEHAASAISLQGHDIPGPTPSGSCPYRSLGMHESRQDIIRLAPLTRSSVRWLQGGAGRRAPTAPSSLGADQVPTVRRRNDLPARRRLLVRGTAAYPDAHRCEGMPLSELSARQNRSATEARRKKRSVTLQSIWTV